MTQPRAYIRQRSGLRLNLLDPDPNSWTDEDLAIGLARTFRWGGHSIWPLPLSVAQHSLSVMILFAKFAPKPPTPAEALRELAHDADESLIGGFDAIGPVKPFLGQGFLDLTVKLQQAVFARYNLVQWTPAEHRDHKHADILAAASEAVHVAGWSLAEVRDTLKIHLTPLLTDPLAELYDCRPWEPWAPDVAAERFLAELTRLTEQVRAPAPKAVHAAS
ncbi:phosphohydrolase [Janthinobacterium sp. CAN_S7]|uniref:phosphohydrolase n=1 Tax=Janthinobacterium sp. CAN_S7 TaxID=3071704 RepID=UPI00319E9CA6